MNSNEHTSTLNDPDLEELSAYLDGELDPDARSAVEKRLADDEAFRLRMRSMEDAWALLDALPQTEADMSFTQTTVVMVAIAAQEEVESVEKASRRFQWIGGIATVLAVVAAGFVGFRLIDHFTSAENEQLVRDLPVIENVELYRHVDDIEFLQQLEAAGLFDESVEEDALSTEEDDDAI